MKFVVSSMELLDHLQAISRVISSKNTLPILDNFLFSLEDGSLQITASDLESTLVTQIQLENTDGSGMVAIPARLLTDTLKEFPDIPLTFEINTDTLMIVIQSENGKFTIMGQNGAEFPQMPQIKDDQKQQVELERDVLLAGIQKSFVASDAHKLVRYKRTDASAPGASSFILPKKPASLLKNILSKEEHPVALEFDDRNASFTLTHYRLVCRLVEGNYPSYNSVIPTDNPYKMSIDRLAFYNTLKRVSVFANQASSLVKLSLTGNQLNISAQDLDFSISANERLSCQYEGEDMEIGFKSTFLIEILSNLSSSDVVLEMSDPTRAGILLPGEAEHENEDTLMLLMPMMINA
jgi:DNA polymerase-3 subunit beta